MIFSLDTWIAVKAMRVSAGISKSKLRRAIYAEAEKAIREAYSEGRRDGQREEQAYNRGRKASCL